MNPQASRRFTQAGSACNRSVPSRSNLSTPPLIHAAANFAAFCLPKTLNQREHLLFHGLEIIEIVPERCTQCGHAGKQPVMGGTATEHPPKAFNDVELGAITRQPIEAEMGMGRQDLLHARAAMPRGLIDRDDDLGIRLPDTYAPSPGDARQSRLRVAAVYCVPSSPYCGRVGRASASLTAPSRD